jgi:uncharacterized protein DUF5670
VGGAVTWIPRLSKKLPHSGKKHVNAVTDADLDPSYCGHVLRLGNSQLEAFSMLVWLAVILLVAWLLGWGVFHVASGLIHVLLVIAVVVFLINFISGRRTV